MLVACEPCRSLRNSPARLAFLIHEEKLIMLLLHKQHTNKHRGRQLWRFSKLRGQCKSTRSFEGFNSQLPAQVPPEETSKWQH